MQVGRDIGAFQCSPVLGYEVLGAVGPGRQLHCIHRLAILAQPQGQPLIVHQEAAHRHTHSVGMKRLSPWTMVIQAQNQPCMQLSCVAR